MLTSRFLEAQEQRYYILGERECQQGRSASRGLPTCTAEGSWWSSCPTFQPQSRISVEFGEVLPRGSACVRRRYRHLWCTGKKAYTLRAHGCKTIFRSAGAHSRTPLKGFAKNPAPSVVGGRLCRDPVARLSIRMNSYARYWDEVTGEGKRHQALLAHGCQLRFTTRTTT